MKTPKHKKHADLARPALGFFARNEWAILGTNCGAIKKLANQLISELSKEWKLAYVDADHKHGGEEGQGDFSQALAHGATMDYTDKIAFHRFDSREKFDSFQFRPFFNGMDAVLVNGNHFQARRQLVVIDPKKEESLQRRLDRLTDVRLIILTESGTAPYGFLKEKLPDFDHIPIVQLADFQEIKSLLLKELNAAVPPLKGLVLAGGKSRRMGTDKGALSYHGKPQRDVMTDLLGRFCESTFLSCRPDQVGELAYSHDVLPDTFTGLGPTGAILSAFRQDPNAAWLVAACDLPLLDENAIRFLIENRNPSAMATAFRSPVNEFPEPLVTIWEPRSYPALLQFLAQGYSCPRKALINSPVHLLEAPDPDALMNVNTPEDFEMARKKLGTVDF